MSLSRKRKHNSEESKVVSPSHQDLPTKSRAFSNLKFLTELKSSHGIAYKKNSDLKTDENGSAYFYKTFSDPRLAQLEAYSATVIRLLAGEEYVPSTTTYYDEKTQTISGLASKELKGFQSLSKNPLSDFDVNISSIHIQTEYQQNILLLRVNQLLQQLESNRSSSFVLQVKGLFGCITDNQKLCQQLKAFLLQTNKFSAESLQSLMQILANRKELRAAREAVECIEKIATLKLDKVSATFTVQEMEKIDAYIKQKNIDLTKNPEIECTLDSRQVKVKSEDITHFRIVKGLAISLTSRYIFKEGDNHALNNAKDGKMIDFEMTKLPLSFQFKSLDPLSKIIREPREKSFVCTARDIREFPNIKDADFYYWPTNQTYIISHLMKIFSDSVATSPVGKNKTEELIESIKKFLLNQLNLKDYSYIERTIMERVIRTSVDEKIALLKQDANSLLPELQSQLQLFESAAREMLKMSAHLYTFNDNKRFSDLSAHPVFEYHKYKTLLKFLLLGNDVYHRIADLQISKSAALHKGEINKTNLHQAAVDDDIARRKEIEAVLIGMPEFKRFIEKNGNFVFEQIKIELITFKEKYKHKIAKQPYYQGLVDAIDLNALDERYNALAGLNGKEPSVKKLRH
jgi:hypothetical protein